MTNAIEKANEWVNAYAEREVLKAKAKLDKEMHGESCGCPNCQKSAVSEINLWLEFLDPNGKFPRYEVYLNEQGKTTIRETGAIWRK